MAWAERSIVKGYPWRVRHYKPKTHWRARRGSVHVALLRTQAQAELLRDVLNTSKRKSA